MDHQDLRTLKLLEEIDKEETPSQRDLSRKLNISLGLVNSFIKRLAQKGYCKVTTIPKNRVRYLLTPKGAAEKTRLTYEYIQSSVVFYRDARHKVRRLFNDLSHEGVRTICFYGVSDLAEIAYLSMQETPIQLSGVVDEEKIGETFLRKTVVGSDQITNLACDRILITDILAPIEAYNAIKDWGVPANKIVMV
ncbi:winged helix-turn-helix transcriptional regulator [Thermodesulfobacteriota bacterium]